MSYVKDSRTCLSSVLMHIGTFASRATQANSFFKRPQNDGRKNIRWTPAVSSVGTLLLLSMWCVTCATRAATVPAPYELATWHGFNASAVSYTLDDNTANQFSVAEPMFEARGLHATFFIIAAGFAPPWDLPDWNAITNASNHGHEIGNHTMTHPDLSSKTDAQVIEEEGGAKTLIEQHTGKKCVSLAYPFCTVPKESITSQFCSFARSCNGLLVPSTPADFLNIGSMGPGDMNAQSDNAADSGNWLVWLIHGIDDPHACCPIPSSLLQSNLDHVAPYTDKWWIDTFGNVCRYIKERDASVLMVVSNGTTSITLQLTNNLDNTILSSDRVFNYPVTLRRPMPSGWNVAAITQSGVAVSDLVVNGNLVFDVVPNGGDIVLSKLDTPLVLSNPTLSASTNLSSYGDPVTFTVTVLTNGIAALNATGTVVIRDWGNPIGTNAVSAGQAALAISNLSVGAHAITAAYGGDSHYTASISGVFPLVVDSTTLPQGRFKILSVPGYALEVPVGAQTNSGVDHGVYSGGTNQLWDIQLVDGNQCAIRNAANGLALNFANWQLTLQPYTGTNSQHWTFEGNGSSYTIINISTGFALDNYGGGANAGVGMNNKNKLSPNQVWTVVPFDQNPLIANPPYFTPTNSAPSGSGATITGVESANYTTNVVYQWRTDGGGGGALTNIPNAGASTLAINAGSFPPGTYIFDVVAQYNSQVFTSAVSGVTVSVPAYTTNTTTIPAANLADVGANITPGAYDISQMVGGGNGNGLNYYTDNGVNGNGADPGQTFTTGTNESGYFLTSVAVQAGGGNQFLTTVPQAYDLFLFILGNGVGTLRNHYIATNFSFLPGDWLRWSGFVIPLQPNTQYAYSFGQDVRTTSSYAALNNSPTDTNYYSGGQICLMQRVQNGASAITYGVSTNCSAVFDLGIIPAVKPVISGMVFNGTQMVLSGTNSMAGEQFNLLTSTNLALPLAHWTVLASDAFTTNSFSITNTVDPSYGQNFYLIQLH